MYFKKQASDNGSYLEERTLLRYELSMCRRITSAAGVDIGWTEFPSAAACLAAWGLRYAPLPLTTEGYPG